jgi:hypothetical protein
MADSIDWQPDFDSAMSKSKSSGKLVMMDFYVVRASRQFVPVQLDAEGAGQPVAAKYGVAAYPTLVIIDSTGKEMCRTMGYLGAYAYAETLNDAAKKYEPQNALVGTDAEDPGESEYDKAFEEHQLETSDVEQMIIKMAKQGRFDEAELLIGTLESKHARELLGTVYNAMGDSLIGHHSTLAATGWFEKTVSHPWNMTEIVHAHMQLARCYSAQNHFRDAENELQTIINYSKATNGAKNDAYTLLKKIRARSG